MDKDHLKFEFKGVLSNAWSRYRHSKSCMIMLFYPNCLQMTMSDIRLHVKMLTADGQLKVPQGFVWVCMR